MDLIITLLSCVLAAGCGYLGGRWHCSHKQAHAEAKLQSDTENFLAMLEERNQDYLRQKEQIDKARQHSSSAAIERDRALAQIEQQQQQLQQQQQQIDELQQKIERMKGSYGELEDQRSQFREAKIRLEAQVGKLEQHNQQLLQRSDQIENKLNNALIDKTRLQTELQTKDREVQEIRQRLIKQEDINEASELSLSQNRAKLLEISQQLANAQGQLAMIETLKQSLSNQSHNDNANNQLKRDFVELANQLSQ